ncbi:hypothetical protein PFAG_02217 [Plasmodium falciparum Santa Lucia]|uniref:Uncharacterized protein n=4 Tax=Plasmodium falciparum TaxID=5833 RepID=A0A024X9A1_PLAFC|nr:hypothetical protein PFNF135_02384 [Plasmodium falciparum NF135/5.C10]ETW49737.1 hypothetical protein PFMALIP_02271 [Plasmodium falciparum MaliPS096_E11]ETW62127.1 hypothetical protein PFMC_02228 [Plasmodium falciparum CAMP/Malaysia]EUT87394.1 hypothetical protein PFAG_02217 [Plasmodium falciparum Santa Lucia]
MVLSYMNFIINNNFIFYNYFDIYLFKFDLKMIFITSGFNYLMYLKKIGIKNNE